MPQQNPIFYIKKNQNRLPFLQSTNKERELRSELVEERREVIQ